MDTEMNSEYVMGLGNAYEDRTFFKKPTYTRICPENRTIIFPDSLSNQPVKQTCSCGLTNTSKGRDQSLSSLRIPSRSFESYCPCRGTVDCTCPRSMNCPCRNAMNYPNSFEPYCPCQASTPQQTRSGMSRDGINPATGRACTATSQYRYGWDNPVPAQIIALPGDYIQS